jgi:hypothetical protein
MNFVRPNVMGNPDGRLDFLTAPTKIDRAPQIGFLGDDRVASWAGLSGCVFA